MLRGVLDDAQASPAILLEPCPCDACKFRFRCALTAEACLSFSAYARGREWSTLPREPLRVIGARIFVADDDRPTVCACGAPARAAGLCTRCYGREYRATHKDVTPSAL
jgi:hypothetical protein